MVKFIPVDPKDVPNFRQSHRGRVSYPILKTFLETGQAVSQLDREGIQQSFQSLYSSLTAYIRSHELPIKLFSREGEIYFARTDIDADGNVQPVNIDQVAAPRGGRVPVGVAPKQLVEDKTIPDFDEEIEDRFKEEVGQVTK